MLEQEIIWRRLNEAEERARRQAELQELLLCGMTRFIKESSSEQPEIPDAEVVEKAMFMPPLDADVTDLSKVKWDDGNGLLNGDEAYFEVIRLEEEQRLKLQREK